MDIKILTNGFSLESLSSVKKKSSLFEENSFSPEGKTGFPSLGKNVNHGINFSYPKKSVFLEENNTNNYKKAETTTLFKASEKSTASDTTETIHSKINTAPSDYGSIGFTNPTSASAFSVATLDAQQNATSSGNPYSANALLSGYNWSNSGTGLTLYYTFWNSMPGYYAPNATERYGFQAFTTAQRDATNKMLDMIETFTKITFVETASPSQAHLGFGQTGWMGNNVAAHAYLPDNAAGTLGGDVWTSTSYVSGTSLPEGGNSFYYIMHEIGHALGLMHTFEVGLTGEENTEKYSVMAYDTSPWGSSIQAQGYQLYDIYALQSVYGANTAYNSGDTTYTLQPNKAYTIWDGGGVDTLSFENTSSAGTINLNSGAFSSTGAAEIAIAYNVTIENATGGSGNDTLIGNALNNVLKGGAGVDTASYETATAAVNVNLALTTAQNTNGAGTDTLIGIESLKGSSFDDILTGDNGTNSLNGGEGNDVLSGGAGDDNLTGGNGIDTVTYATATGAVSVDLNGTFSNTTGAAGIDKISSVENLIGSAYNDTLIGDANANVLEGGLGNDILSGNGGIDTADYRSATSGVTVNLGLTIAQNTISAGIDTLTGIENLIGSAYNDTLIGDANANVLEGGLGNDVLTGNGGIDTADYRSATSGVTVNLGLTIAQNTVGSGIDTLNSIENILGTRYDDTLMGNGGDNLLNAGDGFNDTVSYASATTGVTVNLELTTAQNTIGAGTDTLLNFENITGSNYNDTLTGNIYSNVIDGGAGNDTLIGSGSFDDMLIGGTGIDTASYASNTNGINVNLSITTAQIISGPTKNTLLGIENLIGSNYSDALTGDANANTLNGGLGDDTLNGGLGNDTLIGGTGSDYASYATSASAVSVNLGITTAQDTLADGIDTLSGIENLTGSNYNDTLIGDGNANILDGGIGNDILNGGGGADTASYKSATSAVIVNLGVTTAQNTGGGGTDTLISIESLLGSNYNDQLTGNNATNDILTGGAGNDILDGGAGNDTLWGGAGNDTLIGGTGIDSVVYRDVTFIGGVTVNLNLTTAQNTLGGGTDTLSSIENVTGSFYNDTLTGSTVDNWLDGGSGNDILDGGAGNDTLVGGEGNDTLIGNTGTDTAYYASATAGVTVNLGITAAQITGGAGTDTLSGIENVTGSAFNDTLIGDAGGNRLEGGAGNDIIDGGTGIDSAAYLESTSAVLVDLNIKTAQNTGGGGIDTITNIENIIGSNYNDILIGDAAANIFVGSLGDDTLNGGAGYDMASYSNAAVAVTVNLNLTTAQNTIGAGLDTFISIENLTGSSYNDTLTGDANNNWIEGGAGNDTLNGGSGDDSLVGNIGDDLLIGGLGTDTANYGSSSAAVTVNLNLTTAQNTFGAGIDTLTSIENLTGSSYNDTLTGDGNVNVINGGAGNDIVNGGLGNDTLIGGDGVDTISFLGTASGVTVNLSLTSAQNTIGAGTDTISGFEQIRGSDFNDTLTGDGNSNQIEGGAGNDLLNGGAGIDTASYASAIAGVTVNLSLVTLVPIVTPNGTSWAANPMAQNTIGAGTDTLSGFENLIGSSFNDTLTGDANNNRLEGGFGNDILDGGAGNDDFYERDGNDTIIGGAGIDTLRYNGTVAGVTVNLSLATAQNTGGAGIDTISGVEQLVGTSFNDVLTGDASNNWLEGSDGNDTLNGLDGNDTLIGGNGDDIIAGGNGADTAFYGWATAGVNIDLNLATAQNTGGAGIDTLSGIENVTGSSYNDSLRGDANANTFIGGLGINNIIGGAGIDTISYASTTVGVSINLSNTGYQQRLDGAFDKITEIENIIGSAYNDTLTGDTNANIIDGGAGNDTLIGGAGNDTLIGGLGIDLASYSTATSAVAVNLALTAAQNTNGAGIDTLSGIENLIGSAFNDTLTGNANANTFEGGLGNDTVIGGAGIDLASYSTATSAVTVNLALTAAQNTIGAGIDTISGIENLTGSAFNDTLTGDANSNVLNGGLGNDILNGGAGNDILIGDTGSDTASYSGAVSYVYVNLNLTAAQNTMGAGIDTLSGIENLTGSAFNDILTGDANANTFEGGAGTDILNGGTGSDTASYASASAAVTVNLGTTSAQNTIGAGIDTLVGFENLTGSAFNDTLTGDANTNIILGGNGDDTLNGGAGDDILDGGNGSDSVSYATLASGIALNLNVTTAQNIGAAGNDTLIGIENVIGTAYNDVLIGNWAYNNLQGGAGNDIIYASTGDDIMNGGAGIDTLSYEYLNDNITINLSLAGPQDMNVWPSNIGIHTISGFENLIGSSVNDILTGDAGDNSIAGRAGNDILDGGRGNDILDGGSESDTVSYASATSGISVNLGLLYAQNIGSEGFDTLISIENIIGSAYDDIFIGNNDDNQFEGGSGKDIVSYANAIQAVYVDLNNNYSAQNVGMAGSDFLSSIEGLIGSSYNDTLFGNEDDNIFDGGTGDDQINGGEGSDTITYASAANSVNVILASAQATGSAGNDLLTNIENVTGSAFHDTLIGDYGDNVIDGGAGDDMIDGIWGLDTASYASATAGVIVDLNMMSAQNTVGAGTDTLMGIENLLGSAYNDILNGDWSDNTIDGGMGDDILNGNTGYDTLSYASATSGVIVDLNNTMWQDTIGSGRDRASGFENLTGSAFNDSLKGDWADNIIKGGQGNDTLDGGQGNDMLYGGDGLDTVSYASAMFGVMIDLNSNIQNTGISGTDQLDGIENVTGSEFMDNLKGNNENNIISGGSGDDLLYGDYGDDQLIGGDGFDTLFGGFGSDTFIFNESANNDTISDFQIWEGDIIRIEDVLIGYSAEISMLEDFITLTNLGNNTASLFVDRDGFEATYAMQSIAIIQGIGPSTLDMLLSGGNFQIV